MAHSRETTHEKIMIKYGNVRATRFRLIFYANATLLTHRMYQQHWRIDSVILLLLQLLLQKELLHKM